SERPRRDDDRPRYDSERPRYGSERPRRDDDRPRYDSERPRYGSARRHDGDRPRRESAGTGGERGPRTRAPGASDDRGRGAQAAQRYGRPRFERPGYERREVGRPPRDERRTDERPPARGPELGDDIRARDLDAEVRAELSSLARPVAETVARRLVAVGRLIDEDPIAALAHAVEARRLASRIGVVREAVGLAAYRAGEWQLAIAELRAYHRMTGRQTHLAVLADCERALGRPERAIDMFRNADRSQLDEAAAVELLIVAAGARGDL